MSIFACELKLASILSEVDSKLAEAEQQVLIQDYTSRIEGKNVVPLAIVVVNKKMDNDAQAVRRFEVIKPLDKAEGGFLSKRDGKVGAGLGAGAAGTDAAGAAGTDALCLHSESVPSLPSVGFGSSSTVAAIFEVEPLQWGLRGDPLFWRELKAHFQDTALPYTPEALQQEICKVLHQLTGQSLKSDQTYYVASWGSEHGGMSSGVICGEFWLRTAIPELQRRLRKLNAAVAASGSGGSGGTDGLKSKV